MMQHYPIARCENPRKIQNPYTGDVMVVPCGHCRACRLNRCSALTLWCDLETQQNQFCLFVTLTYANRFIPRAQFVDSIVRPFAYDLVSLDGEILSEANITEKMKCELEKKCNLFGHIPYLRITDFQKFLKRLRYYVKKQTNDKIRYYGCGEYGPVHFRPHYHLLLWFNRPETLEICRQAISASWPFGRIDVQIAGGSAASYVTGYVNSFAALPEVLKARAVHPFCVHSAHLGCRFLQSERAQAYASTPDDFIRRSLTVNGKYREFSLWRAYYVAFFPKCRRFADSSAQQCITAYRIYDTARRTFPDCTSVIETAKKTALMCRYFGSQLDTFGKSEWEINCRELCRYFDASEVAALDVESEAFDRYIWRIYRELLLSRHFLNFVCDNWTITETVRKIRLIKEFYARLDYLNLRTFFEEQQLFFDSNLYGEEDLLTNDLDATFYPYFYDNVNYSEEEYKSIPVYKLMTADVANQYYNRIKHKVLNDQNLVFCQDDEKS